MKRTLIAQNVCLKQSSPPSTDAAQYRFRVETLLAQVCLSVKEKNCCHMTQHCHYTENLLERNLLDQKNVIYSLLIYTPFLCM